MWCDQSQARVRRCRRNQRELFFLPAFDSILHTECHWRSFQAALPIICETRLLQVVVTMAHKRKSSVSSHPPSKLIPIIVRPSHSWVLCCSRGGKKRRNKREGKPEQTKHNLCESIFLSLGGSQAVLARELSWLCCFVEYRKHSAFNAHTSRRVCHDIECSQSVKHSRWVETVLIRCLVESSSRVWVFLFRSSEKHYVYNLCCVSWVSLIRTVNDFYGHELKLLYNFFSHYFFG